MDFKEPKVEVIRIDTNQVVYASPGAGGVQTCIGSIPTSGCTTDQMMDLNTGN